MLRNLLILISIFWLSPKMKSCHQYATVTNSWGLKRSIHLYIYPTWMFYSETCGFSLMVNPLKLVLVVKWKNINTSLECKMLLHRGKHHVIHVKTSLFDFFYELEALIHGLNSCFTYRWDEISRKFQQIFKNTQDKLHNDKVLKFFWVRTSLKSSTDLFVDYIIMVPYVKKRNIILLKWF